MNCEIVEWELAGQILKIKYVLWDARFICQTSSKKLISINLFKRSTNKS